MQKIDLSNALTNLMGMSKKKVLVTGGSGFIGSYIMKELGPRGINFDLKIGKDLFSEEFIKAAEECEAIIHLAIDPIGTPNNTDVEKTNYIANVAARLGLKIVFASSAAVYADLGRNSQREMDELQPLSAYAQAKMDSEYLLAAYRSRCPITVLRYFNVYGEGQNPAYAGVITKFLEGLETGEVTIYGDGNQSRDFIRVEDVAKITVAALDHKWNDTYINVGTGKPTTINELLEIFIRRSGKYLKADLKEERPEIYHSCSDNRMLRSLWGQPDSNLEEGIKQLIVKKYG